MKHFKAQTLLLTAVIGLVSWLRFAQPAPLGPGSGGPGGPSGFGLQQNIPFPGHPQRQQSSTKQSTALKYLLDEENAGYFRGEWMSNSTRIFHRSRAQLKRTECSARVPPATWKVEYFLNHSNAEEGEDKNRTVAPNVATSSTPLPLLGRKKRFLFGHQITSCTTNRSTRVIRDERENRVEQFPLSTPIGRELMRVSSEDVFGDSGYPQNKEVVWQIELPESRRVGVYFYSFNLDRSTACGDYISIHNENGDLHKFCAQETSEDMLKSREYIVGKKITVKFVTSASGNGQGFSALLI